MKLFFIPYAGGMANSYAVLKRYIDTEFEIILVELAGRGRRTNEAFYEDMNEAVNDVAKQIKDNAYNEPYAIFGHSMGGLIIYELLGKFEELKISYPKHIFISARRAAHLKSSDGKKYYKLPDEEFALELLKLGDINREVIRNAELFNIFSPIIRADYKIIEEYVFKEPKNMLKCNMTLLYASEDIEASKEEVLQWREYSENEVECFEFNGGHFYIFDNLKEVANIINNTLNQYI